MSVGVGDDAICDSQRRAVEPQSIRTELLRVERTVPFVEQVAGLDVDSVGADVEDWC